MIYDIDDLTDEQVLGLSEEETANCVRTKQMQEGIVFASCPDAPKYVEIPETDSNLYKVDGVEYYFETMAQAEKVRDAITAAVRIKEDYDYNVGYHFKYAQKAPDKEVNITTVSLYTEDTYNKYKSDLSMYKQQEDLYKKDLNAYNTYLSTSKKATKYVTDRILEVKEKYADIQQVKDTYAEYLKLSDGNTVMAMKFLLKAFDGDVTRISHSLELDKAEVQELQDTIKKEQ